MNTIIWKKQKIGEIAIINMGQSPESKYYNDKKIGLPFLQGNRTFGSKYPTFDTFCSNGSKFADPNDILMSVRAPVGDLNITKERIYLGRGLASLKMKNGNYEYLFYLLKANVQGLVNRESGTVFGSINKDDIYNFEVLVAQSDDDQRRIADILSALDDKIELNRQTNATLEAIAQAIFKEWFVDFNFPGATGELVESELGMIPKGWRVLPLDEVADFLNGLALQKYPPENENDYLPVIKIRELKNGITDSSDRATNKLPEKYIIHDGDLIFSWSGTLEVSFWVGGEGALNQHLFKVTSKKYPLWFCYYWISYHLKNFREIAEEKTTTMGHIKREHLASALCLIPDNFDKLNDMMSPIFYMCIENRKEDISLSKIRDNLLPKLMNGEIEV